MADGLAGTHGVVQIKKRKHSQRYTEPAFRRRGLARLLVEAALHACKVNEVDLVILHASEEGRRLYEGLGFKAGNEMRIRV